MLLSRTVLFCAYLSAFLFAGSSLAANPIAVIDGPSSRKVGDPFILDGRKSIGDHHKWKLKITLDSEPENRKAILDSKAEELRNSGLYEVTAIEVQDELYISIENDQRIILPTYPGLYEATLVVSNADGIEIAEYSLRIVGDKTPAPPEPTPDPDVDPTPPGPTPSPVLTLQQAVTAAIKVSNTTETHAEFQKLAESYDKVSNIVGLDVAMIKQTTDLFTSLTLSKAKPAWNTILTSVVNPRIVASGISTPEQYNATWKEIAAGIRAGLGPQPPPTPDVDPVPPTPIPGEGLRVLIRYEAEDFNQLPSSQIAIFTATEVVQWLTDNCVKDGYRITDDDLDTQFESDIWQNAYKTKAESLPWINISNGVTSFSGPLPKTIAETMTLLKKYKP